MKDRAHYIDMLDRNPDATVGASLAAKMIVAAKTVVPAGSLPNRDTDEAERAVTRRLLRKYGETLTNAQVRAEIG